MRRDEPERAARPGGRGSRRRRRRRAGRARAGSCPSRRRAAAGGRRGRPGRRRGRARPSPLPAPAVASSDARAARRAARGRASGTDPASPCAKWRESRWSTIAVPPSTTGKASRQSRSARPSATVATVIGFSRSRGEWWCFHGIPITIASSGRSSRVARRAIPRRSASACATDGGPGEGGDGGELAPEIVEDAAAQPGGEEREPAQRRGRELLERRVLVRVAAEAPLQPRRVEDERGADHRHARGERALERERRAASRAPPPSRAASRRSPRAASPAPHAPSSAPGAAVEHGLGGA